MYSQNNEEKYITEYFKDKIGNFLDFGAFNPFALSNTRRLFELGWCGIYAEPSMSCFKKFEETYQHLGVTLIEGRVSKTFQINEKQSIYLYNYAIGTENKTIEFYDSKGDAVSTSNLKHKEKWAKAVSFEKITAEMISVDTFLKMIEEFGRISFFSLDVEGNNLEVFNLFPDWFWKNLDMLCIEHDTHFREIIIKLSVFGFSEITRNAENLILAK